METTLKTAPLKEPVTIDDAKKHLRVDDDYTDDDSLLVNMVVDARSWVEQYLWRKLISQTWYAYLEEWPAGEYIELPFGTLQSVIAIKYTDTDAVENTWSSGEYIVGTDYLKGRVTLGYGYTWPNESLLDSNPIEIEFKCGYGDDPGDVPGIIRRGINIMVAEMYENREISVFGQSMKEHPLIESLLAMYRLTEL
jgi:uncharacterized phiE125 gp8 family phage protein